MSRTGSDIRADNPRLVARVLRLVALAAAFLTPALPAGAAVLSGVQTGTAVSTANGTLTVTIASVNTARSILFFEARSDNGRPPGTILYGHLATATTIQFVRQTNETPPTPINIRWYVATFTSGVNVQRGLLDQTATAGCTPAPCMNVPITAVGAVSRAFVL